MPLISVNEIVPGLWQGADPPHGHTLSRLGFDTLVLCAIERQHGAERFPGLDVVHAPMDDSAWVDKGTAFVAARRAALAILHGHKVYVACAMGLNRSGLVSALALWMLTGCAGVECLERVRRMRRGALGNRWFARFVERLPARQVRAA